MFDLMTTVIGVSFTVLALALVVAAASIIVCIATLIKNLPKGIRALRAATESSVYALALCGQSVAEEARFARLQFIFGKRFLFGVCGIYVSVAKFFAGGVSRAFVARPSSARIAVRPERRAHFSVAHTSASVPALSHFSVVMKQ